MEVTAPSPATADPVSCPDFPWHFRCTTLPPEDGVTRAVATTLSVTLFLASAWSLGARNGAAASAASRPAAIERPHPAPSRGIGSGLPSLPVPSMDEPRAGRRDLYGNEVSDAVATYKRDRAGSVYEEHSPQTEVPRLTSPTT
jgi:hypothetical protein